MQVDNPMNVIGECPSAARTMTSQNVCSHTNPNAQLEVYDEPLPFIKGLRDTMHPPFGVGVNRGQQISKSALKKILKTTE